MRSTVVSSGTVLAALATPVTSQPSTSPNWRMSAGPTRTSSPAVGWKERAQNRGESHFPGAARSTPWAVINELMNSVQPGYVGIARGFAQSGKSADNKAIAGVCDRAPSSRTDHLSGMLAAGLVLPRAELAIRN